MANTQISVARIVCSTSVDGVGLRNALYVAGCNIRCKGCHNSHWWNIQNGTFRDIEDVYNELNQDEFNISILGGEPLLQPQAVIELCRMIKERTNKTIWLWSGHTLEYIKSNFPEILNYIDVLVDGPFIEELAEPNLQWRGSTNQRVIDIKECFKNICLWKNWNFYNSHYQLISKFHYQILKF